MGETVYRLFAYFIIYAFLGWCVEVVFVTVTKGKLVNRGFLNGPICPIYGVGFLGILALLRPVEDNLILLYLGGMLVTTAVELAVGWLLYRLFHARWWDYTDEPFNLGGYICLKFSLMWGFVAVFAVKLIHPVVTGLVDLVPRVLHWPAVIFFGVLLLADFGTTVRTVVGMNHRLEELDKISAALRKGSDALSQKLGEKALSNAELWDEKKVQLALAKAEGKEELQAWQAEWSAKTREMLEKRRELKRTLTRHRYVGMGRLLRAFPDMKHMRYDDVVRLLENELQRGTREEKPLPDRLNRL